jgi:hypothetical protein
VPYFSLQPNSTFSRILLINPCQWLFSHSSTSFLIFDPSSLLWLSLHSRLHILSLWSAALVASLTEGVYGSVPSVSVDTLSELVAPSLMLSLYLERYAYSHIYHGDFYLNLDIESALRSRSAMCIELESVSSRPNHGYSTCEKGHTDE